MKKHERLLLEIEEQRLRIAALEREQTVGLDSQIAALTAQMGQLASRITQLEARRAQLPSIIQKAQARLIELLGTRKVEETPDLKKLVAAAERFKQLKEQAEAAGIDINSLLQ